MDGNAPLNLSVCVLLFAKFRAVLKEFCALEDILGRIIALWYFKVKNSVKTFLLPLVHTKDYFGPNRELLNNIFY